ncbi:MAG: cysteine--tRNA ligase [Pseudomonadota bacterium]
MSLQLHDTRSGEKRVFKPIDPERVTMYVCGPTVYNYAHIGNARPAVVFDVLSRLLRHHYTLVYARNITDVDDKINQACIDTGRDSEDITGEFTEAYLEDMRALGVAPPDISPRATDHIAEMCTMIEGLIADGHAYEAEGHVLFSIESFDAYGELSGRDLREMIAGARVEVAPYKRHAADFVLWKPSTPELPGWNSPWGRGRPGWHLECSAMIEKHLGKTIDIHGGGQDLVFPHHENERAQSMCAHGGAPFVNYWLHNGFLNMNASKMSKSLGNVMLVRELLEQADGEAIRLALLSAHYRQPLDWTDATLPDATRKLDRLYAALKKADEAAASAALVDIDSTQADQLAELKQQHLRAFMAALEDDINTPKALAELFAMARAINRSESPAEQLALARALREAGALTGLLGKAPEAWFATVVSHDDAADDIEAAIAQRTAAKQAKDFATADRIRDELAAAGVQISDGPDGTTWRRVAGGS